MDALFGLAFATASPHGLTSPLSTNSQAHSSKGTLSPHTPNGGRLQRIVGTRFQDLFHSPPGVLFTFPSRYWCTIGHGRVFSLGGWSPQIPTGFLVSRRTQVPGPSAGALFRIRGSHPLRRAFPGRFRYRLHADGTNPVQALQPRRRNAGLGSSPFARRY